MERAGDQGSELTPRTSHPLLTVPVVPTLTNHGTAGVPLCSQPLPPLALSDHGQTQRLCWGTGRCFIQLSMGLGLEMARENRGVGMGEVVNHSQV